MALGALVAGFVLQRHYLERRYTHLSAELNIAEVVLKAQDLRDARIAISGVRGVFNQYAFSGTDLSNHVQWLGIEGEDGAYLRIPDCETWREEVNAGEYDYVVTMYDPYLPGGLTDTKEGLWTPRGPRHRGGPARRPGQFFPGERAARSRGLRRPAGPRARRAGRRLGEARVARQPAAAGSGVVVLGILVSALLIVIASVVIGRTAMLLAGWRRPEWLAGAVGLAVLVVLAPFLVRLPGRGLTAAILLALLTIVCAVVTRRAVPERQPGRRMPRRHSTASR